jgi:hypothetical protein
MQDDTQMTLAERRKYLGRMRPRYLLATRAEQSRLLDEMEAVTGMHRKSLLRLLHAPSLARRPRTTQRTATYAGQVEDAIGVIWESLDYICAERLTPALHATAKRLIAHAELALSDEVLAQLASISIASVQRRLRRFTQDTPRLPRQGPQQANRVARAIPMQKIPWETSVPGHFEVDLVHHGGPEPQGDYVYTLQLIDVATGWSERVAVFGRSQRMIEGGFRHILARLPFAVRELHPDNGSEFLNAHLVRFWGEAVKGVRLSRSRPYQKNDNRFVEQKNATLVRAYLGQARLDTPEQADALNALYDQMWVYYNICQPVLRLREKARMADRVIRRWDTARAPLERLLATEVVSAAQRQRLEQVRAATNPRALRQQIYADLARLLGQPVARIAWEQVR